MESHGWKRARTRVALAAVALLALLVVVAAIWDQKNEVEGGLSELKQEQATLAAALGAYVRERVSRPTEGDDEGAFFRSLFGQIQVFERPGDLEFFLVVPGRAGIFSGDGGFVGADAVRAALLAGETSRVIERDEAPQFGLPRRMAVAGMHRFEVEGAPWGVVTITSARSLRDRWRRSDERLVFVGGALLALGALVLLGVKARSDVERALEARERDALLARADKMATMAALGTGIAHEIASPLGVIVARVEQLQALCAGDEKAARAARIVGEQVERIQATMRGVLALARGERPSLERVAPGELIEASVAQIAHRFEAHGVALEAATPPGLPAVSCDRRLLEQALINLLLNAADAPGVAGVRVSAGRQGEAVVFSVEDDGEGMGKETIARATEPFFTTKVGRGTGLGLAIVHEIVKHHQGQLRILPRADGQRGTRVEIEINEVGLS